MLGFMDFMERAPTKKYVAVQYDDATQKRLRKWATDNGFDLTTGYGGGKQNAEDFDFHTTIFYTTTEHSLPKYVRTIAPSGTAKVVGFEMLGIDNNIPVLKVESSTIQRLRKHFEDAYGMKDAWPTFKPHVSLSYATSNMPNIKDIKLPTFELTFNQVKVDDALEIPKNKSE
jgi:2'-5' RNA ligase